MDRGAWRRLQFIFIVCDPSSLDPSFFTFLQPCLDKMLFLFYPAFLVIWMISELWEDF